MPFDFSELDRSKAAAVYLWQRAEILMAQREWDAALNDTTDAIRRASRDEQGYVLRAWILATADDAKFRDGAKAVAAARAACELSYWYGGESLACLAAAHAECGHFEEAVKWQTEALEHAFPEQKDEFARQLAVYESGKPLRAK